MALTHAREIPLSYFCLRFILKTDWLAEDGFNPLTSGLWAQIASAAQLCFHTFQKRLDLTIHGLGGQCLRTLGFFVINMTNTN
jgi:hypothetical protein